MTHFRIELEFILCSDGDSIFHRILCDDEECRSSAHLDPFSLTDCVREGSFMFSDHFSRSIENITLLFLDPTFEEFLHRDLSDEAEPL